MTLVRPPLCECEWVVKANEEFELSDEQRQQLTDAIWFSFRYRTKTMTPEENAIIGKQMMAEFTAATSNTFYSGGWVGKRQY